jgi:hypothetical protein
LVSITITSETATASAAGFGVPLVLHAGGFGVGHNERVQFVTGMANLDEGNFPEGHPTRLMLARIFAQTPRPERVAIGRRTRLPTQVFTLTPTPADNTSYRVRIGDMTVNFTSTTGGGATAAAISTGLAANAGTVEGLTLAVAGDNLTITGATPGAFAAVSVENPALLRLRQTHADPGVATDLDEIAAENSEWYAVLNPFNSEAEIAAISGWVETRENLYIAQSVNTDLLAGADTFVETAGIDANRNTAIVYSRASDDFLDAAIAGRLLPTEPGAETWALKALVGPGISNLTETQKTALRARNVGWFYSLGGLRVTQEGKTLSGGYIDFVRFVHYLRARLAEGVATYLARSEKVPYDDAGFAALAGLVRARLQEEQEKGAIVDDPPPFVSVPKAASASAADRSARRLNAIEFGATYSNGVHRVAITGNIAV